MDKMGTCSPKPNWAKTSGKGRAPKSGPESRRDKGEIPDQCPVCGGGEFAYDYERGEIVCRICGTVVRENLVDLGPECRSFGDEERRRLKARAGPPITASDLRTAIGGDKDARGEELGLKHKLEAIRLRRWQIKAGRANGRLDEAARELGRLRSAMMPRPCVEQALGIYRQALERELTRGQSAEALAAAALYAACRMLKMPMTLREITRYTRASRREIARGLNAIAAMLKLPPPTAVDYARMAAARLGLDANTTSEAIEIARKMRTPSHLAAAVAIYIAARGRRLTIEEAAEAAGVSAQALERRLKELGVRPVYSKRPSEEGEATKARRSSNEIAILGPYVLTKARRGKSNFMLRGELALELAYNLRESGVITDEKLAEVEEIARRRVEWHISVGRLAPMELGAEFVRPRDEPKNREGT